MKTIKKTAIIAGGVFGVLAIVSAFSHDFMGLSINVGITTIWVTIYKLSNEA